MRHRNRRTNEKKISLDEMHQAIKTFMSKEVGPYENIFDDALQAIETVSRPKTPLDIENMGTIVTNAVLAAGNDSQNWKLLALSIIHRRYHSKAPESKAIKKKRKEQEEMGGDDEESGGGHGERLSFYIMFMYLHAISHDEKLRAFNVNDFALKICECLARLAFHAGGTRDVCALIEHLVYEELDRASILEMREKNGNKRALCQAVMEFVSVEKDNSKVSPVLTELLRVATSYIDKDLKLIDESQKGEVAAETITENRDKKRKISFIISDDGEFQSTINTFIPHHNRGNNARKMVQSVAELMIWSQSFAMGENKKFSDTLTDLSSVADDDDKIISSVHTLQTAIRRMRKKLNASSRAQGFSLYSSFLMDQNSINLDMVKSAKHGDVTKLQQLASKTSNLSVVRLIANRFTDPSKAISVSSIPELERNWISTRRKTSAEEDSSFDELAELRLEVQEATVQATLDLLRRKSSTKCRKSNIIVASLDRNAAVQSAAILAAAALNCDENPVTLYLREEKCNISSFSDVMNHLDEAFTDQSVSDRDDSTSAQVATTKDIQNLIDRHLGPDETLLLFATSDVKLEQRVLTNLQKQRSFVHCHVIDEFAMRMEREKAKVGDITITLAWDNQCDLDLSVKCPNGDLIYYGEIHGGSETGGGYLDVDMNVHGESKEPVENVFFGDAEKGISADHGLYEIMVTNFAYHGNEVKCGDAIQWRVRLCKDGETEEFKGACQGSGYQSAVLVTKFEYKGRTKPFLKEAGSALSSSNVVSVTSSRGISMDSISELMSLESQYAELETVRNLIEDDVVDCGDDQQDNRPDMDSEAGETLGQNNLETTTCDQPQEEIPSIVADISKFQITNRDRLFLNFSKLPNRFHQEVNTSMGGANLSDHAASVLAKHLTKECVHINELKRAGYQSDLIDLVEKKMKTFGVV